MNDNHEHPFRIAATLLAAFCSVAVALFSSTAAVSDEGNDADERARSELLQALESSRAQGDELQEARALARLGQYFEDVEDYPSAVASYADAVLLWRSLGDRRALAEALDGLGRARIYRGEMLPAAVSLRESLELWRELGAGDREAKARNLLCLIDQRSGRFREAGACYEATLELIRRLGDRELEATLLNNLGGIYQNLGEPVREREYFELALALHHELGNEFGEAATLYNLGASHQYLGEVGKALELYAAALLIFERLDESYWLARVTSAIGYAHLTAGELERARAYLLRALELRREVGDSAGEAVTLLNLGRTFAGLDDPGKALAFYRKALENHLGRGDRRGEATARRRLGEHHLEQRAPQTARSELELALAYSRETGQRRPEAEVLELLGRVELASGAPQRAAKLAEEALALSRAVRQPAGEVAALITLARVHRERGQTAAARQSLETALEALEALYRQIGDPLRGASFLAAWREVHELYVDTLMELHWHDPEAGLDRAALEASERGRSRALLGWLESAGPGLGSTEPALGERLREAERLLSAKTRRRLRLLDRPHEPEEALLAEQEFYAALAELESARAEMSRASPRFAAVREPAVLGEAAIRALLDEETVLLEFLLGEERSYLWWVTPETITAHELPPRQEIEELATRLHRQLSAIGGPGGAFRESLDALSRMLLAPVADPLDGQRLVIIADGALHLVPFAALTSPGDHEPLVVRHEVAHLPSASVLALSRRKREANRPRGASKTLAILADPIFEGQDSRLPVSAPAPPVASFRDTAAIEGLGRLPHTRHEAEAIAALLPASHRLLAMGAEARRSRVVEGELAEYRLLHFATHGFIHPRAPWLSGLVLSRHDGDGGKLDGFLGLHDVAHLDLTAELVVLSGCRTALGKHVRGEGLVGLSRGFMYAGVPRVVASLWQVRDRATAELMARFYRALLVEDLPPAAALRTAQLALREERRYRDPFYWAAFVPLGDWR